MGMMSAVSWPSEVTTGAPVRQRALGQVRVRAVADKGRTRLDDLSETGSLRIRLPKSQAGFEAVLVNTAGGVACGDHFSITAEAGPGAALTLASPAAEKVYRSDGPVARIDVTLKAEAGAALHWLPQETILFDTARLSRHYAVEVAPDAAFLSFEAMVFGRAARGEVMAEGHLTDQWRIRRGGELIYADAFRLSGPVAAQLAKPAIGKGAAALATFLYVAGDAEARLDGARDLLSEARCEVGASAWNGILAVRWIAADIETLRRDATSFLIGFREAPMPRVWAS
ncbi:urease accessory protein UreD [Aquabacter cavernae]|uniref:urease accessory protein UreD n=1 Tax=Aquabacter cavernae TaxID=2496029 RepID=UPI001FE1F7DA|nr:urease accessory protein UreD [Aquabacter cavernae]